MVDGRGGLGYKGAMGGHLFIVARHHPQLFRYLKSAFADEPDVEIIVDRRHGERRVAIGAGAVRVERRRADRRASGDLAKRLASIGYAFVRLP